MKRLRLPAFAAATLAVTAAIAIAQFGVDPDSIYLHVSVVEASRGRLLRGLPQENFKLLEDDKLQNITYFSQERVPLSVGIVIDTHGEMKAKTAPAMAALTKSLVAEDQHFVSETGNARLNDAALDALTKVLQMPNPRRALVLVTDRTNPEGYVFSKVRELLRSNDIQLFAIAVSQSTGTSSSSGGDLLRELAELTGGEAHFPSDVRLVEDICKKIVFDLKNQYVIGYRPTNSIRDGKWRKVKVSAQYVGDGNKTQKPVIRTRSGYYATAIAASGTAKN